MTGKDTSSGAAKVPFAAMAQDVTNLEGNVAVGSQLV